MDELTWPDNFMDIGLKSFRWVYANRPEFVDFSMNDMEEPTGLFLTWQNYCKARISKEKVNESLTGPHQLNRTDADALVRNVREGNTEQFISTGGAGNIR